MKLHILVPEQNPSDVKKRHPSGSLQGQHLCYPRVKRPQSLTNTGLYAVCRLPINCYLIADAVNDHLETGKYLEEEQKGCKRRQQGTKDQLLINRTILEDCKARSRNLSMAWVDYKKAYNSVPHSWLIRCLDLYKISPTIKKFHAHQMEKWKTSHLSIIMVICRSLM